MGHKKNQLEAITVRQLVSDSAQAQPTENVHARPRLGAADDPWSAVFKDVVREAPKTALIVAGAILLALVNLILHLVTVFAGYGAAAPPMDSSVPRVVQDAFEVTWHAVTRGG